MKQSSANQPNRPRVVSLYSDIYDYRLIFIVGARPSQAELSRVAKKYGFWSGAGDPPTPGDGEASCHTFGKSAIVWIKELSLCSNGIPSLMHEMIHVVTHLAQVTGQKINFDTDEMHAYFAGWAVRNLIKAYLK